jgi:predicted ATPase
MSSRSTPTDVRRDFVAELPRGTVSFLFTDIEESTALWERDRGTMAAAVQRHIQLLRSAIASHDGVHFKTVGDAVQAAFPTAPQAVAAALAAQRALLAEDWGEIGDVRVRMALHAGEAEPDQRGDYLSAPLNRLSRLLATGHGGQILLTQTVQQLTRGILPPGAELRDMGEHQLRDLLDPEHVYQLLHPDIPDEFPPLQALESRPNNLPRQPTPFLGREQQVAGVVDLLRRDDVQLVTLIGPGGTGKTRLALQAAAEILEDFADGVYFVDLAPLIDPELVPGTVAAALGVREEAGSRVHERLRDVLSPKKLLLVLDNFERLTKSANLVSELLVACPGLKVLATSRVPLHVRAEQLYPVPPLTLPDPAESSDTGAIAHSEAVQLFVERAQAAKPDFALTSPNAPVVAEIVRRLDGLPLAIELAAARVRLLPPAALLQRLESRLTLLTGGPRDAPIRQRTLRDEITWSYDLLSADEQGLFRRLAAFVGGFTLAAAEAVTGCDGEFDVFAGLASLVESSLVRQDEHDGEPRFGMLETIREYGLERLVDSGEEPTVRKSLATYFLVFAQAAEPESKGLNQLAWLERLETEHANFRAVLGWALEHDAETALRLAGALWWFWRYRAHFTEGRSWLERALARSPHGTTRDRAKALRGAGVLARQQSDYRQAAVLLNEALARYRDLGDAHGVADSLDGLGNVVLEQGDLVQAERFFDEALSLWRALKDTYGIAGALDNLGSAAQDRGQLQRAMALREESLALYRTLGDEWNVARLLNNLGYAVSEAGDLDRAAPLLEEALTIWGNMGDKHGVAYVLENQGSVAQGRGELERAATLLEQALVLWRELGDKRNAANSLQSLGRVVQQRGDVIQGVALFKEALALSQEAGDRLRVASLLEGLAGTALVSMPERASQLLGAAEAMREALGVPVPESERKEHNRSVAAARTALGETAFAAAWAAGRALPEEEAVNEALALVSALVRDSDQARLLHSAGETP